VNENLKKEILNSIFMLGGLSKITSNWRTNSRKTIYNRFED